MLEYEGSPFRCHWCHELGHLLAQCLKAARVQGKGSGASGKKDRESLDSGERENATLGEGILSSTRPEAIGFVSPQHVAIEGLEPKGLEPLPKEGLAVGHDLPGMLTTSHEELNIPNFSHVISSFSCFSLGTSSILAPPILPNLSTTIPAPISENPSLVASEDSRILSSEDVLI